MALADRSTTEQFGYPVGTRGLDPKTLARLAEPLTDRLRDLARYGRRFPIKPFERDAIAESAPVDVRFFIDGDVTWAEVR